MKDFLFRLRDESVYIIKHAWGADGVQRFMFLGISEE